MSQKLIQALYCSATTSRGPIPRACQKGSTNQFRRKSWKIKLNKHRENSLRGSINESFLPRPTVSYQKNSTPLCCKGKQTSSSYWGVKIAANQHKRTLSHSLKFPVPPLACTPTNNGCVVCFSQEELVSFFSLQAKLRPAILCYPLSPVVLHVSVFHFVNH